jgi:uncharacterized LabA/DUF88 family protein
LAKAAIFIDGGYLAAILRNYFGGMRVDFSRLSEKLAQPDLRFRTYNYYCMPYQSNPPTMEERNRYEDAMRFFNALRMSPRFEVRHGRLKRGLDDRGRPTFEQKGVDVLMSVDLVKLAATNQIDRAVLVTGDSDFVPAIKVAKESINVSLYYYPRTVHNELMQVCDDRIEITSTFFDDLRSTVT